MKKLKIVLSVILILTVLTSVCACNTTQGEYEINYDIDLNEKPNLNILMPYSGRLIDEVNNDDTAKVIENVTGYKVTYTQLPSADASQVLNNELMDRRSYNAMKLNKDQFSDLVKDDLLVDITDALKVFAPDILKNISDESWDVVTVNGRIYGIPERASSDNIENPIVFNQDLMLECNLEVPTTLEEFENVLKVLSEKLGRPALTFDKNTPLVYAISAAFGIYTEWQEYEIDGKTQVLYYMNAPRYKDYVDFMNSLYQKRYIDQNVINNTAADATNSFVNSFTNSEGAKSAAYACSLWTVTSLVTAMNARGIISSTEASGTMDNYLCYLRALKSDANAQEKVYRSSGFTYIVAIPFYEAENAGYALDWMNSKIKDTDEEHNFRDIVLGTEGYHWTYSQTEGYLPIAEHFLEKDESSYYLTGSNETKYTQYWLARVRKQPELYRAWSQMMQNADQVAVYNIVDFTPPIEDYNSNRAQMELYAQDQFYIMLSEGTGNLAQYLNTLNNLKGGTTATTAINDWYAGYQK